MTSVFTFFGDLLANLALAQVLPAVIIAVVGILGINLVVKIVKAALDKSKLEKAAHKLILSVVRIGLYLLLALMVASKLGIDVTGIVALASVVTLAVSLALQDALSNLFGGFVLLSTHPFKSGDYVEVAGQGGTVTEIGMTYTKLTTPDNKLVSLPNSAVTSAQIINYSATGSRRVDITVTASYNSPIEDVRSALLRAAQIPTVLVETEPGVLVPLVGGETEPVVTGKAPFAAVKSYGESSIEYILQVWTSSADYWTTLFTINQNLLTEFKNANVEMTYPHLNIHLDK